MNLAREINFTQLVKLVIKIKVTNSIGWNSQNIMWNIQQYANNYLTIFRKKICGQIQFLAYYSIKPNQMPEHVSENTE